MDNTYNFEEEILDISSQESGCKLCNCVQECADTIAQGFGAKDAKTFISDHAKCIAKFVCVVGVSAIVLHLICHHKSK